MKIKVRPGTVKSLRERRRMTQQKLSDTTGGRTKVSPATIKRIETADAEYAANSRVAEGLAKALGVSVEALNKEPPKTDEHEKELRNLGYRALKTMVDGETALAFQMVEHLYGIPVRSQILMAPLFSAILAEGSFAWRRERLEAIDAAADELMSHGEGHFSFANAAYRIQDGARDEENSISKRDLFGKDVGEDTYDLGFDPSQNNPFADYLKDFIEKSNAKDISLTDRCGCSDWKTEGLPEYTIAPDVIENLTGGNSWAEFALLRGFARLRDIPESLWGDDATEARIEWLESKIPADERARREKWLGDINLDEFLPKPSNTKTKEE